MITITATTTASQFLSKLNVVNKERIYYDIIEGKVLEEIDNILKTFVNANNWHGVFDLNGNGTWFAQRHTTIPNREAWFDIDTIDSEYDNWLALFCGVGCQGGKAGFMFNVRPRILFPQNPVNNATSNAAYNGMCSALTATLQGIGFLPQPDNTQFFLPVLLDLTKLENAFATQDPITSFNDDGSDFQRVLEKLDEYEPIFEGVFNPLNGALDTLSDAFAELNRLTNPPPVPNP